MPLTGRTHRLPHSLSSQNKTPGRRLNASRATNHKVSHRFVRIHRKYKTSSRGSSKNTQTDEVIAIQTLHSADRDGKHKVLLQKNGHLGGEVTAIPNPIPDTGFRPTATLLSISSTGLSAFPGQTVHSVPLSKTGLPSPTFSSLRPLMSLDLNSSRSVPSPTDEPFNSAYEGPEPSAVSATEVHKTSQPRKLSIPLIVLLAVGSGVLLIGVFSLIKYFSRPTRRPRPKPSRPILDDPFADDKRFPMEESPIFGGKERISGSNGAMWSWSQYPRPTISITKPEDTAKPESTAGGKSYGYARSPNLQGNVLHHGRPQYRISGHAHTQSVPVLTSGGSPYQASLQQLKGALSRTANRISATSVSLYPTSPQSSHTNVGLAITRSPLTTFTADGSNVLKRTEPKAALDRSRNNFASEASRGTISTTDRSSEGSAYDGSEMGSPSFLPYAAAPMNSPPATHGGRSRIKSSYYTPGSYPRASNASEGHNHNTHRNKPDGAPPGPAYQASVAKSESRRDRDTQALTYALGLSSPATDYGASAMPSPQPTLYPDDSLSVVDARRPLRKPSNGHKKKASSERASEGEGHGRPSLPVISTAMDASAALGSLMLLDSSGQKARADHAAASSGKRMSKTVLSKPAEVGGAGARSAAPALRRNGSRSDDKPPSIPLPAPLPSLSQMGLEHANPQAYADYRSPTYSIFGLYGSERKSGLGQ
ncbi:hypothetical protein D9615_004021 [Tricholomella constricta]|uniref:Uncharacterized protein n=1 Tax=Tricholomella constricta TaxID=117010 RepID=A0A8H5M4X7_9AGAR|nr:hypothetical protein D9615_004021 [Tricholomella constricta]